MTEKKTAEQILHEHSPNKSVTYEGSWCIEAMKEYARQCCAEQRDICAESAKTKTVKTAESETMELVDKDSIRNAKAPEI